MEYSTQRCDKKIILAHDVYKGYEFYITSLQTHPTAYVLLTKKDKLFFGNEYQCTEHINCHGGLTYSGKYSKGTEEQWIIGWDYAHLGDRLGVISGKEWTTEEIYEDVKNVIEQVIEFNKLIEHMTRQILEED